MRTWWRDVVATLLVAAIVIPYVGYLVNGEMPFIKDPRGMAGTALILGLAACAIGGSATGTPSIVVKLTGALSVLTLTLGFATLLTENELLLALFIGSIVLMWAISTVRHVVVGRTEPAEPISPAPPKAKVSA